MDRKKAFLEAFKICGRLTKAAQLAGVTRGLHYRWLAEDPDYVREFNQARAELVDLLIDEAVRRAREGTQRPVFYQGEQCGVVLEYSDALMIALLKAWAPEFRDKVEHSGPGGGPIALSAERLKLLSDDELAALTGLLEKLSDAGRAAGGEAAP